MSERPLASLSLDLDNQWAYMMTHGSSGWDDYPSYLDAFVPHMLRLLEGHGLEITVFIVGKDASLDRNREALQAICQAGHELGNHSFHHEQWIHTFSRDRIRSELADTGEAILRATGQQAVGYRGPGFSWNAALFDELHRQGFQYDASTLPTYIGPLARLYYLKQSSLEGEERDKRKNLFGGLAEGRRPVKPYLWQLSSGNRLLEIPVTTIPVFKTPFHLSYLLYLSRFSRLLMLTYLRVALTMCRMTGTEPSFLLHPLDLIGPEQAPELAFFPGMDVGSDHKREVFDRVLTELTRHFRVIKMSEHARLALEREMPVLPVPA